MPLSLRRTLPLAILAAVACAEAGGDLRGGEVTPIGDKAASPPPFLPDASDDRDCGEGTKWSELYRDVFGPSGQASCALDGSCHGSADAEGAQLATGILCADEKGCRQSLIDKGWVAETNAASPDEAPLLAGLLRRRRDDGSLVGYMPKEPAGYVFPRTCIERIEGWIAGGVQED